MVQPVLKVEENTRVREGIIADRQVELEALASSMPKTVEGSFPYLMEIKTGHIHPWSRSLAERSDLVVGCYNLAGSFDPEDADPYYDPQGVYAASERRVRVHTVAPQTVAEKKAAAAAAEKTLRRELEEKIRQELEEKIRQELEEKIRQEALNVHEVHSDTVVVPETVVTAKSRSAKGKRITEEVTNTATEGFLGVAAHSTTDSGDDSSDLDAAFDEVMQG